VGAPIRRRGNPWIGQVVAAGRTGYSGDLPTAASPRRPAHACSTSRSDHVDGGLLLATMRTITNTSQPTTPTMLRVQLQKAMTRPLSHLGSCCSPPATASPQEGISEVPDATRQV
jgi:hypothetical protein